MYRMWVSTMTWTNEEHIISDLMFRNTPELDDPSICIKCRKCYTHWLNTFQRLAKLRIEALIQ